MIDWRNIGRQWKSATTPSAESAESTAPKFDYARSAENYRKQREYENTRNQSVESARPSYDNSVNPGYAVGTRKYSSPTPGRQPKSWL